MAKQLPVGGHAARKGTSLNLGRGARGIDGNKGDDFSRKHAQDPWAEKAPRRRSTLRDQRDDDYSRGAVGIDGTLGEDFSSRGCQMKMSAVRERTMLACGTSGMRSKVKVRTEVTGP